MHGICFLGKVKVVRERAVRMSAAGSGAAGANVLRWERAWHGGGTHSNGGGGEDRGRTPLDSVSRGHKHQGENRLHQDQDNNRDAQSGCTCQLRVRPRERESLPACPGFVCVCFVSKTRARVRPLEPNLPGPLEGVGTRYGQALAGAGFRVHRNMGAGRAPRSLARGSQMLGVAHALVLPREGFPVPGTVKWRDHRAKAVNRPEAKWVPF